MPEPNLSDFLEVTADQYRADASAGERWACPRRRCCRIVLVRPHPPPEAAFRLTSLWDISAEGIGLLLARSLEPGAVLDVHFRHAGIADRQARVVHAVSRSGGWHVVCLLDRPFTAAEAKVLEL
jgi:hypothetical protein